MAKQFAVVEHSMMTVGASSYIEISIMSCNYFYRVYKPINTHHPFNPPGKFEVTIPRRHSTECVVALRSVKYSERYLCINSKAKIKLHDVSKNTITISYKFTL